MWDHGLWGRHYSVGLPHPRPSSLAFSIWSPRRVFFYPLPCHLSIITLNRVCLFLANANYRDTTALTSSLHKHRDTNGRTWSVTRSVNQVIFMLVTEPLLALVPSFNLAAHSEKLRLSFNFWVTPGPHCLPPASGRAVRCLSDAMDHWSPFAPTVNRLSVSHE